MKRQSAFTLVEMLVAMTILLMVSFIGSYTYSNYSALWNKEVGHFDDTFAEIKGVTILFNVLNNIQPYVLKDEKGFPFHYFEGGKSVIRSITASGMAQPEVPAMFELRVEENGDYRRIVYRESPMTGAPLVKIPDSPTYRNEVVILAELEDVTFEFKGWPSLDKWIELKDAPGENLSSWYGFYSGSDTKLTPNVIKISLSNDQGMSELLVSVPDIYEEIVMSYFEGE